LIDLLLLQSSEELTWILYSFKFTMEISKELLITPFQQREGLLLGIPTRKRMLLSCTSKRI
jgi:hypothetical protein